MFPACLGRKWLRPRIMSAGNDEFIRRRICDPNLGQPGDDGSPLRRRSLSQMWASVQADADDVNDPRKSQADQPKNSPGQNEE